MLNRSQTTLTLALVATLLAVSPALAQHGIGGLGRGHGGGGGGLGGWGAMGIGIAQGIGRAAQNRNHNNDNGNRRNNNGHHDNGYNYNYSNNNNYYVPNNYNNNNNHSYQSVPQNNYVAPQPTRTAPQTAAATPPANDKPPVNLPPAVTTPKVNALKLTGRPLTADELKRAREFFTKRMEELTKTVMARLPAIECDQDKLMVSLVSQGIAGETQVRLLDAIRIGDYNAAQELWLANCTAIEPPFRMSRLRRRLTDFCGRWDAGQALPNDGELLEQELFALGLETMTCCGAPSLLEDIQHCLLVSQAIAHAQPGTQSQMLAVPPGEVDIIYHPNLPHGETIVVGQETVMLGTGGIGNFHMQHGNVAQAQGYSLLPGPGAQASDDRLVSTGILIENPAGTPVQFTLDKQAFTLQPGASQVFTGESRQIAFNTGDRGKVTTYALPPGTYRFETPNRTWDLHRVKAFEATIDNRNNDTPFQYIAQGEHQEVAARSVATHTSPYPVIVRFDRGNGAGAKQVACTTKQATFFVGVNPQDNLWDMHASVTTPTPASRPAGALAPAISAGRPAF